MNKVKEETKKQIDEVKSQLEILRADYDKAAEFNVITLTLITARIHQLQKQLGQLETFLGGLE